MIRHSETGEIYEIESDELDWNAVGGGSRQMGSEIHYEATVEHPELVHFSFAILAMSKILALRPPFSTKKRPAV